VAAPDSSLNRVFFLTQSQAQTNTVRGRVSARPVVLLRIERFT
jgi:hypothetical protein